MSKFMLRRDALGVVADLKAGVASHIDELKQLAKIKGAVEHIQCGAPLPAPTGNGPFGRYSVELLNLSVAGS